MRKDREPGATARVLTRNFYSLAAAKNRDYNKQAQSTDGAVMSDKLEKQKPDICVIRVIRG